MQTETNDPSVHRRVPTSPWRIGVGAFELIGGAGAGCWGCYASIRTDASLAGVGALISIIVGWVLIAVPGLVLLKSKHIGWWSQLVPGALVAWIVWSRIRG